MTTPATPPPDLVAESTAEHARVAGDLVAWRRWGPYLSERSWGTVREDYSADGSAWDYLPHDHARSRAYRWNEDGLAGICDDLQRLCFAVALWNGRDPILKERLFGLSGTEGNHGEDVKECYFYLDSTPTHSYMRLLYKYPQRAFPYAQLVEESGRRGREAPEYELLDTGICDDHRYFDVLIEYAKADPRDVLIRISATNRGPEAAPLHVLPTLWFRNTWSWGYDDRRPSLSERAEAGAADSPFDGAAPADAPAAGTGDPAWRTIVARHRSLGRYELLCEGADTLLFTENETNVHRLFGVPNPTPFVKDAFHRYLIDGEVMAVNPAQRGTKAAAWYRRVVGAGETVALRLRLRRVEAGGARRATSPPSPLHSDGEGSRTATIRRDGDSPSPREWRGGGGVRSPFDHLFAQRQREADEYYAAIQPVGLDEDRRRVHRQALAGLLWSKQFYHFDVERWLRGDPAQPPPPQERQWARNREWRHMNNADVISMPDKWEYPWFAAWDLAFHCVPLALVDPELAKNQLVLLLREWYQHPNGQVPAYEWAFGDVNPPVLAWAAWRVYKIDQRRHGGHEDRRAGGAGGAGDGGDRAGRFLEGGPDAAGDLEFLERVFHKLLLYFTWWVNRKDSEGNNVFQGGFLGLDNIGVFDRSAALPTGGRLEQSDGTSWMAMFSLNMMTIALELAENRRPAYEDVATKFFEHFLYIAGAMNNIGGDGGPGRGGPGRAIALWDEEDEFCYDVLHLPDGTRLPLRVRSLVGLIPLLAVETVEPDVCARLPAFARRLEWFLERRPDLASLISRWHEPGAGERRLLALMRGHRMKRLLKRALDPAEFLSDYGVRSLSKYHEAHPYVLEVNGTAHEVRYEPAESRSGLFGGNSNWRGPIWFPINYLLIEALQKFHHYYGDDFIVECPTGSGRYLTLDQIGDELSARLIRLFLRDRSGHRPFNGANELLQSDPQWRDHLLFHEYFHGDTGAGLGAAHQTGWTALVAKLIDQQGRKAAGV
jgi:hypothetical protein